MSQHKRRSNATPATGDPPSAPPPRPRAPVLPILKPDAAGIDVHSDMHMVCVNADRVSPMTPAEAGGLGSVW